MSPGRCTVGIRERVCGGINIARESGAGYGLTREGTPSHGPARHGPAGARPARRDRAGKWPPLSLGRPGRTETLIKGRRPVTQKQMRSDTGR